MKLRCTRDSIRIRVRKSELKQLAKARQISENICFGPDNELSFALKIETGISQVIAQFEAGQISIILPDGKAESWINSQEVGIEEKLVVAPTRQLHILIEKDFPCIDRDGEDKTDTFWELASDPSNSC